SISLRNLGMNSCSILMRNRKHSRLFSAFSNLHKGMVSEGKIEATRDELNLEPVLMNGQAFRWTKSEGDVFFGVAVGRLWRIERVDEKIIRWLVVARCSSIAAEKDESALKEYFQMDVPLVDLYEQWKAADANVTRLLENEKMRGIRILAQPPLECLLSFICSANNNIKRIS
ncbi:hypothetical protein PFISCL1PPCAC_29218, partial [Pristionchus fissidentatus]